MARMELWRRRDLEGIVKTEYVDGNFFSQDSSGNLVGVEVYKNGAEETLTGSVTGYCILKDGTTVSVAGTRTGNKAYILVPQSALAYEGPLGIVLKLIDDTVITTLLSIVVVVYKSKTDTVITPSAQIITDWSNAIADALQEVEDAVAAQDAEIEDFEDEVNGKLDELNGALINDNAVNLLSFIPAKSGTASGVEYTWDGKNLVLDGTAGSSGAAINLWADSNGLANGFPEGVKAGDTLYVKVSGATSNARINITFYNGSSTTGTNHYLDEDAIISVPNDADGMRIRGWVSANKAVDTTISTALYRSLTNEELTNRALLVSFPVVLPDQTDIDTVIKNGWYTLSSGNSYTHSPINDEGAMLFVFESGNAPVQIMIGTNTGEKKMYTRSGRSGSFSGRDWERLIDGSEIRDSKILSGGDLDDLSGNECVLLTNSRTYTHNPFGAGMVFNLIFSDTLAVQFGFEFTNGTIYYRRKSTTWGDWKKIAETLDAYKTDHKYVAFGDSLVYGAVWSATEGTALHQVKSEWRIPTRIALATGFINQYVNEAIGGIGYLKEVSGQNLIDQIGDYTFTDVDLVTIMAGANDKAGYDLGTKDDTAETETICGAIRNIIQTIVGKNPKAQIIIIQPPPSGVNGNTDDVWSTIPTGWEWSMNQFDEQVSQLCHDEHVGYLNWWDSTYCRNWKNVGYNGSTGPNYTHPTADYDYCVMGDFIAGKVASLYHTVT